MDDAANDKDAALIRDSLEAQQVCPFCGFVSDGSQIVCSKCTMENSAVARKATKLRIGPWYVLQNRNPAAPGMKWETLLSFIRKGRIKPHTVIRGPTTHQLWRFAAHVKGLSREFGVCYSCGGSMEHGANLCPHCNRLQEPPINPDTLLEGAESEARSAVFKEIAPPVVEASEPRAPDNNAERSELDAGARQRLADQADELLKEQHAHREAIEQEREALAREKEAAVRDRDAVRRQLETAARERETVEREKESIERERLALARERELIRRERETRPIIAERAPEPAATPADAGADALLWDDAEPLVGPVPPAVAAPTPARAPLAMKAPAPSAEMRNPGIGIAAAGAALPRGKTRDGGFLSPKDLATAFKLNHAMALAAKERKSHGDDASASRADDNAGSRFKPIASGSRRGGRKSGGRIFLVLVLLVWAIVLGMVVNKPWRSHAMDFLSRITTSKAKPAATTPLPPPGEPPTIPEPSNESVLPPPIIPETQPTTEASTPQTAPSDVAVPARAPLIDRAPVAPGTGLSAPMPSPVPAIPTSAPASQSSASVSSAGAPPPATGDVSSADLQTRANTLYGKAKAAEIRGDLAESIRLLEQIKLLPPEVWPTDLEMRLRLDKVQIKQQ